MRLLLITALLAVCNAQDARESIGLIAPKPAICLAPKQSVDEFKLDEAFEDASLAARSVSAGEDISESVAKAALDGGSSEKRLAPEERSDADSAKSALIKATGPIVIYHWKPRPCPGLTNGYGPVTNDQLCPSEVNYLRRFWYASSRCYVLFPNWQRIRYRRCLCKNCRFPCAHKQNFCRAPARIRRTFWAICKKGWGWWSWTVRRVTLYLPNPALPCTCYASGYGKC